MRARVEALLANGGGERVIAQMTLASLLRGMDGVPAMPFDSSTVDAQAGVSFRGLDCDGVSHILPESMLPLLLTGTPLDGSGDADWHAAMERRANFLDTALNMGNAAGRNTPMTVLAAMVLGLDELSARHRGNGPRKGAEWEEYAIDAELVIGTMPLLCAAAFLIARGTRIRTRDIGWTPGVDWISQFCIPLSIDPTSDLANLIREYARIHCCHGTNLSTTVSTAVASGLATLPHAVASGISGLSGPRHGLANINTLTCFNEVWRRCNGEPNREVLAQYVEEILSTGVYPGAGHRELEVPDPRGTRLMRRAREMKFASDPRFTFLEFLMREISSVMQEVGKKLKKNVGTTFPNVDFFSGPAFAIAGLEPSSCYTNVFAMARAMGWAAGAILWHVRMGAIFRPGSYSLGQLEAILNGTATK